MVEVEVEEWCFNGGRVRWQWDGQGRGGAGECWYGQSLALVTYQELIVT